MQVNPEQRASRWYDPDESATDVLQGDVFLGVPLGSGSALRDVIVLTQSCELEVRNGRKPVIQVLLAPCVPLHDWFAANPAAYTNGNLEGIRKGYAFDQYVLPPDVRTADVRLLSSRLVIFPALVTRPFAEVEAWAAGGQRALRLQVPYREHFGQAVARYFMRVGLPIGVGVFEFKRASIPEAIRVEAGEQPWPSGPVVKKPLIVQLERQVNVESGDELMVARLQGPRKVQGCGRDAEQAMQSLWLLLRVKLSESTQGALSSQSEWSWLAEYLG